jgi:hypothetical protein
MMRFVNFSYYYNRTFCFFTPFLRSSISTFVYYKHERIWHAQLIWLEFLLTFSTLFLCQSCWISMALSGTHSAMSIGGPGNCPYFCLIKFLSQSTSRTTTGCCWLSSLDLKQSSFTTRWVEMEPNTLTRY